MGVLKEYQRNGCGYTITDTKKAQKCLPPLLRPLGNNE